MTLLYDPIYSRPAGTYFKRDVLWVTFSLNYSQKSIMVVNTGIML